MPEFTHYSGDGSPVMVDVTEKQSTRRMARASGNVRMAPATIEAIRAKLVPKGDLFEVAKIAGIMAAKKNAELIPLCHPLHLTYVDVSLALEESLPGVKIFSEVRCIGETGAEMEALTAVSVAALTVYDMCKAIDTGMIIADIKVIEKKGGVSDHRR